MVHLTNTSRSATFLIGIGILMLFFFCAPTLAQSSQGFKSTSACQINASVQSPNVTTQYSSYKSTIYSPFTEDVPSSNGPSRIGGRRNSGSDDDDDIGIPGWADTPSEPLPIGDTLPLFLFAAAMIAIIAIRQRKQKQLQSITTNNNNNTTQHMTTRKQTYQSFFQKLFLLLAFVCVAGQVSADKTIYFRPSTAAFRYGYTDYDNMSTTWPSVYWTKGAENFFPIELRTTNTSSYTSSWTAYSNLTHASQIVAGSKSRFISVSVPDNYKYIVAYRCAPQEGYSLTQERYDAWKNTNNKGKETTYIANQNTIPKKSGSQPSSPELIPTDGRNLLCNKEGWWDVWYWAYYLPTTNDVKLYFDNSNGWSNVQMLFGKDIYSVASATLTNIPNTKLCYRSLNGAEYGYEKYGFIGNSTAFSTSHTLHPYKYNCVGSNEGTTGNKQYLTGWVDSDKYEKNNENTTAKNNRIENRIKTANKYTITLSNLLSGSNLFIPGSTNTNVTLTKHALTSYSDLNHPQTVTSSGGGSVTISSYKLNNVSSTISTSSTISSESSTSIQAAYTATVTLTATPASHCKFLGWYDKDWNELSTSLTYTYAAPNEDVIIHAIFGSKKKFRMQIFENKSETSIYDKNDWTDSNQGGTLTFSYTKTNSTTYTETIDDANQHPDTDIYPTKTLTITATPKSGYIFVGFWNNLGYPVTTNPWNMTNPGSNDESVTARFAKIFQQKVYAHTYNAETDVFDAKGTSGGSVTIEYPRITNTNAGCEQARATTTGEWSDNVLAEKTTMTITASAADGYEFLGWYSTAGEPIDWMNEIGATVGHTANAAYTIVAHFHKPFTQYFDIQTEIGGQYQNSTTGGTAIISYNDGTKTAEIGSSTLSIEDMYQGSMNTLTATPEAGYRFVGWYNGSGALDSSSPTYTYRAEGNRTVHARFARNDVQLVVSVMNYNTDYADFVEYPHDNNTVTIAYGGNNTTVTSSTSAVVNYGSQVTLTATPDSHETEGYDFIGWYQNNQRISTNPTYTFTITDHSAISAHFAPKQCHKVILYHTCGGQYQVKYARPELFDSENGYYVANSLYNKDTTIFVPYEAKLTIIASTAKPTIGYEYTGYYRITKVIDAPVDGVYTIKPTKTAGGEENTPEVFVEFIRTEDQIVYLDLTAPNAREDWKNRTQYFINVRNIARKAQAGGVTAANIELTKVKDGLYSGTIPGNIYTDVTFYYEDKEGDFKRVSTTPQVIPATRNNCFILNGVYSSTDGWIDGWTTLDTENGDYRLIYREQTVVDKNTIRVDYEFNEGDRIKKRTTTGTDIVSLHIYNKVSSDGVNGINNPEVILQQWSDNKDAWVDVERYMVFGPLRSNDASVIKMPNRKNTANEVVRVDLGINNIMTDKTDNGCGVWNFVIEQDGTTARLLVDETHRYEGNYYIRTTNADGQYNNFTHPNNVMTYSEFAKKNSDFSHYFVRYVDIYEDGTPTAIAGKHPVVKFTIANDHAMFLCKELMINNNRFTDDEYGDDLFVKNVDGAPNLPVDATVRFGWDIVTNRLTRAYIADTEFKNNEYLIVEGDKIGDISDEKAYFDEIGDHFYQIDLNAQVPSDIKVKAKMNGNYQYFMGSENATDQLIGGQANGSYPLRLLYDFKNDRFITICELAGTINGNIHLATSVMIMREHNDAPKQLTFANDASITATPNVPNTGQDQYTKPAYAVMTFLEDKLLDNNVSKYEKMYYWVSFPFDVKIKDVFGLGDYGKYWIMEEYDGAQRAQSGLAQTNWKYITKKSHVLKQNVGYVLCLNYNQILQDQLFTSHGAGEFGHSKLSLYFPSNSIISPAMLKGGQSVTRTLERMENNATAWNHHNWHLIGVPSFATPGFDSKQDDIPFLYQYWHPGDAYAAVTPNDVTFHAMHSFMVQYYGDITWTSVVNTGGSLSKLAAKTDEEADKKVMLRLELQQAGSTLDKTYVQLRNDKGTKGFDMSLDLTKIINAGANIYSIVDNHEMAGNAVPKEESIIPLGVVITAAGEYTFAMPNGTEGMMVELIDYEQGTSTNLLVGDYTVNIPVGTNNTRFALRMKPDKVATSVEDITSGTNDTVRKLLIDGVLYLQKGNTTYDAQGHVIR
jgi:hypothetical protein